MTTMSVMTMDFLPAAFVSVHGLISSVPSLEMLPDSYIGYSEY